MQKTVKLYHIDAYQTTFRGTVLSCVQVKPNLYTIVLDQTLFFPEEGGQSPDAGTLCNIPVLDVQINQGVIHHYLSAPLSTGVTVEGCIRFDLRFSNMQQHSGEHIVSGLLAKNYGFQNVGFHLSPQTVTLDFDGILTSTQLHELEKMANESVFKNIPITTSTPPPSVLSSLTYRSKKTLEEEVRIVTIAGVDQCACCAPHVSHTGEIGLIKFIDAIKYKSGMRITIQCGQRALLAFCHIQAQTTAISVLLSTPSHLVASSVERLQKENQLLKTKIINTQCLLIEEKIQTICDETQNVWIFFDELEPSLVVKCANQLTEKCTGICGVFVGNDCAGYRYVLASSQLDVSAIGLLFANDFGAKGGGTSSMIQGAISTTKEVLLATKSQFFSSL